MGILVSSTSTINRVRYLIERMQESERLIVINHHDKILSQVKKFMVDFVYKSQSLDPANISEEINNLLKKDEKTEKDYTARTSSKKEFAERRRGK